MAGGSGESSKPSKKSEGKKKAHSSGESHHSKETRHSKSDHGSKKSDSKKSDSKKKSSTHEPHSSHGSRHGTHTRTHSGHESRSGHESSSGHTNQSPAPEDYITYHAEYRSIGEGNSESRRRYSGHSGTETTSPRHPITPFGRMMRRSMRPLPIHSNTVEIREYDRNPALYRAMSSAYGLNVQPRQEDRPGWTYTGGYYYDQDQSQNSRSSRN